MYQHVRTCIASTPSDYQEQRAIDEGLHCLGQTTYVYLTSDINT